MECRNSPFFCGGGELGRSIVVADEVNDSPLVGVVCFFGSGLYLWSKNVRMVYGYVELSETKLFVIPFGLFLAIQRDMGLASSGGDACFQGALS